MKMKDPFNKAFIFVKDTFLLHTPCRIVVSLESTISTIVVDGRKLCAKTVDRHVHNVFCVTSD